LGKSKSQYANLKKLAGRLKKRRDFFAFASILALAGVIIAAPFHSFVHAASCALVGVLV